MQVQNDIKVGLFEIIYQQRDTSMKKHIADTIGEIAGSIIGENAAEWPDFKKNIWKLFQDQNIGSNFTAFYILQSFFTYAPQYFAEDTSNLYSLFKNAFMHQNMELKISAMNCFSSFLEIIETKKHSMFQGLIIPIYQATYSLLKNNSNDDGLTTLSQMIDTEPRFFRKKFRQLYALLKSVFEIPKLEMSIKRVATQILVDFSQKYPKMFRKHRDILQYLIEMIFFHMVDIDEKITEQWKKPQEGYNEDLEDDDNFQTTRFGMGAIDRIIFAIGEEQVMPLLSTTIQKLLAQNDWRYKYTAVMALSQVGEYIQNPDQISSVLEMIATYLRDDNPMLRYASCHAIGQISDDMQPKFQQKYGKQLYPELLRLLSDPIPRVVSHSAAALTNFLEGMKYSDIEQHFDEMMKMLLHHTINGISLVQQSALSAISSTVQIAKQKFHPYLQTSVETLFSFYEIEKYKSREYKQLKGQCIQTLTIIASSVGGQMFKPAALKLIQLLIVLQSSQFEQTDPQKSYILAGWQRLCLVYGKDLGVYLDRILPSLFVLVEKVISNQLDAVNNVENKEDTKEKEKEKKQDNINTYQTQQAQVAISMLNVFIEQLKQLYGPYVQKTVLLLCHIIKEHPNEDVKQQACKCLPNLITAVKLANRNVAIQMAKYFMKTLVDTIQNEFDSEIIIVELQTLKSVIQQLDLCFLNQQQVTLFSEKILNLLKVSDSKKFTTVEYKNDAQVDQEEKQIMDQQIKKQQEVQVAISQLVGILFKTHKNLTVNFAQYLINHILPKVFSDKSSEIMLKFGIFLIDDMVQYLGFDLLDKTHWFNFGNLLVTFSSQKSCMLRQAACYGIGILAQNTPSNTLSPQIIQGWLQALVQAVKIPMGAQKQKTYGHCRDNGVASIGKILKSHGSLTNATQYIQYWLSFLPLRFDKQEAIIEHQFLIDIMLNKDELIIGNEEQSRFNGIVKVLGIYGDILNNVKIYNKQIKNKMKEHFNRIRNDTFFQQKFNDIWNRLTDKQRNNIMQIIQQQK